MKTGGRMREIFDLIRSPEEEEGEQPLFRLGVRLKIGDHETVCPITKPFESYEALDDGVQFIREDLAMVLERARKFFEGSLPPGEGLDFDADATPEEIWALLSEIEDEDSFIDTFNGLEEARRKAIAEHVLTHCNVFTGKASVFSSRYNNDSSLMA